MKHSDHPSGIRFALAAVIAVTLVSPAVAEDADGWTPLFDGKSLDGWSQKNGTATYQVEHDSIVGRTKSGSPNSFLCSDREYGDFELEFEVKVDKGLNSGVQIRSQTKDGTPDGRVNGPQVEIESSGANGAEAGYVYGEATGRGWLTPKDRLKPRKVFKDGEWNRFRILARGPRIQTWINGEPIEDLTDEPIFKSHPRGFIGLQVHAVGDKGPFEVRWRKLRLREFHAGATTLFDGSSLDAWMRADGGAPRWIIDADHNLARTKKGGYIWTRKTYGDFVLEFEFKLSSGCNSGVFIRTNPKDPVQQGFEIQLLDSHGRKNPGKHDAGAFYDARPPMLNAVHPAGQWNSMRIQAEGSKLLVHMNGKKIQDLDINDWNTPNQNPDGSKNKFKSALKDLPQSGHIGFQDHGHPVWIRNVVVVEK